jgi:hypothetical protein
MAPRHILSPQSRAALFDPPTDPAAIVRHYTFSADDLALIRQRRRAANRLGFAVHLAYLRFPGRVLGADEAPPVEMVAFVASQIECDAADLPHTLGAAKLAGSISVNCNHISTCVHSGAMTRAPLFVSHSNRRTARTAVMRSFPQ